MTDPDGNRGGDAAISQMLWAVTTGTAEAGGAEFFSALVRHLAAALRVPYVLVAECTTAQKTRVRTVAFWNRDRLAGPIEYDLAGTPCEAVIEGNVACHPRNLQALFPRDTDLATLDAESYVGLPITAASGEVLGHLAVIGVEPVDDGDVTTTLLRTFAARAGMELERLRALHEIAALNQRLQAAAERARTLLAVTNAVVVHLTPEALFGAIVAALRPVIPFDRITIFLHDAQRNVLRLAAAESAIPTPQFNVGLELPLEGSHAAWAFRRQQPYFQPDLAQERRYPAEEQLFSEGFRSFIVVPLVARGRSIGTLNMGSVRPMQYGSAEADLLQEVTNQVALAIENMREYEEIDRLKAQLERENVYLREEILGDHNFEELVGTSPSFAAVLRTVERVAPTDTTVLVLGETGTGKELVARAIHNRSPRHARPMVKVNCGAIPAGLIESELFGHVKGAFTGALDRRTGRFELADRGTLFLDEVGELPLDMQVKLLRVLQEQEFEPVGGSRTVKVNVRVIAATNRDLEREVAAGRFRQDLFYRLNVLPISVPALRDRRADIPALVMYFVQRHAKRIGRHVEAVSRSSMEQLERYDWPGNVRELENVIERALVLSQGGILDIALDVLPAAPATAPSPHAATPASARTPVSAARPSRDALDDVMRAHIRATLEQTGWVVEGPKGAARILDIHPNTLRSRMQKLGIVRS
jgi:formate hydrogenlyase transcriptional activator